MPTTPKKIAIIAGPNGAGKTTFAREFLPYEASCPIFVNADLIAVGLDPFHPEAAAIRSGRLMIEQMQGHLARGESFAFETTLAGTSYVRQIPRWRALGYSVELFFLSLSSPEIALARVAERVRQGGHSVPEAVVRRRFASGLDHFHRIYRDLVDAWLLFDNSSRELVLLDWSNAHEPKAH